MAKTTTLYASAARTATPTEAQFTPGRYVGIEVHVKVTAIAATPSVVFTIQGYDVTAAAWYDILASAAVTTVSTNVYRVDPRALAAANLVAQRGLPSLLRLAPVHGDADSITYTAQAVSYL
jgi:hypothetical protein